MLTPFLQYYASLGLGTEPLHEHDKAVSIHTLPHRRGALRETNRTCRLRFNPQRLRKTRLRTKCAYLLAITTLGQMQHGMALFQSKRRAGRLSPDEQVSIHAPARGATFQQLAATSVIGVLIHAFERE